MNKAELVDAVTARLGDRKAAADHLEVIFDEITRAVVAGDKVLLSNFGSFEKVERAPRLGRNPRTGEAVKVKKTVVARFKPGTALKQYVAKPSSLPKRSKVTSANARGTSTAAGTASAAKSATTKSAATKTAATKSVKSPKA